MTPNLLTPQGYNYSYTTAEYAKANTHQSLTDDPFVDLLTLGETHLPGETENSSKADKNILRDTLLRYIGYANEFTEAGKTSGIALAKALNPLAWFTVFTYGISDALNRSINKHTEVLNKTGSEKEAKAYAISDFGKDISFHALATWFGPVYLTIKPVAKLTEFFITKRLNKDARFWPALASLSVIPFVPKLFDPITEKLLDFIYTPASNFIIQHYLNRSKKVLQISRDINGL